MQLKQAINQSPHRAATAMAGGYIFGLRPDTWGAGWYLMVARQDEAPTTHRMRFDDLAELAPLLEGPVRTDLPHHLGALPLSRDTWEPITDAIVLDPRG